VLAAIKATSGIKALAHITGGGFVDNIPRVLPENTAAKVDLSKISVLPVFKWLAKQGGVAELEMLRTFNCGIGLIIAADAAKIADVEKALRAAGEKPIKIGEIVAHEGEPVTLFENKLDLS
jgi:phosphoribosylformylglycinamidine cyclo-ligase